MLTVCIVIVFYLSVQAASALSPAPHATRCPELLQRMRRGEEMQASEVRSRALAGSGRGERDRAVQIFPSECLKDGGVFVALSSQVPQMAQCTSNGKPFIWPWDCTCCTSRWFMEETSSDSLSRRHEGIMEERHKRAGE